MGDKYSVVYDEFFFQHCKFTTHVFSFLLIFSRNSFQILAMSENPEEIIKYGVFKGFNIYVFIIVVLQALTGLVSYHFCDVIHCLVTRISK